MSNSFQYHEWNLDDGKGNISTWEQVSIAVLMDIRREFVMLNTLLQCPHFLAIPQQLKRIAMNTTKKRKKKATR